MYIAQCALLQQALQPPVDGMEREHVGDLKPHIRFLGGCDHLVRLGHGPAHRLLNQDVLTRVRRGQHDVAMGPRMRRDIHRIDILSVQDLPVVRVHIGAETPCDLGRRILVDVRHSDDLGALRHLIVGSVKVAEDPAAADYADSDFLHCFCLLCRGVVRPLVSITHPALRPAR